MKKRILILLVPLIVAMLSMGFFVLALFRGWFGEPGYTALVFCEQVRDALIKQPANTWSNLGFLAAGLSMSWQLARQQHIRFTNRLTRSVFFPTFLSTLTVLLCPGSMAMHATTTMSGGYFDMLSMYLLASFMFAYAYIRFFGMREPLFFTIFLLVLLFCHWVNFLDKPLFGILDGTVAFGSFVVLASALEIANVFIRQVSVNRAWGYGSAGLFLLAFIIWSFSKTGGVLCDPESLLQGHAAWHLLDAAAVYCLFRFYVSENDPHSAGGRIKAN